MLSMLPMNGTFLESAIYRPKQSPGHVAWATAFQYADGSVGLSFDETVLQPRDDYSPATIEFAEAAGIPVSYGSVESGAPDQTPFRVYMCAPDGIHFEETGRCKRAQGALCNIGFEPGHIIGYDVPRTNQTGTGWSDFISVRESMDGGHTFHEISRLLPGTAPYLWRVRQLKNGKIILLASLYGTPWGKGQERATRNTMLPGETYLSKILTFFMMSDDGIHFDGPNYILPGLGAHEYDVVELSQNHLLFIAGDVQGTPVGRQYASLQNGRVILSPVYPVGQGAPNDPVQDPQGGYLPETIAYDEKNKLIYGFRRGKCFSVSNDEGENWMPLEPDNNFSRLYQPFLLALGDGRFGLYGHEGGDNAFGEKEMCIRAQIFSPDCANLLTLPVKLSMQRLMDADGTHYINAFRARLTSGQHPVAGEKVVFRVNRYWLDSGAANTCTQEHAPRQITVRTDQDGCAEMAMPDYDANGDIHMAYTVDVIALPSDRIRGCAGPMMTILAMTPRRENLFPFDAYFAGGTLYLSPLFMHDYPDAQEKLSALCGQEFLPGDILTDDAVSRLLDAHVIRQSEKGLEFIRSIHAPRVLNEVKPMQTGDMYR